MRSRLHPGKEHRQHPDEKHDGFLHRHALLLAHRLRPDVRRHRRTDRRLSIPSFRAITATLGLDIPLWVYIVFQTVFCATAATIVSGSMAERTNFKAYCVYSAAISLVVYPICGHWMWGGGWLQSMGFHDFAGSAAVHNVGGVIALLGAWMLGPRIGKYDKDGNPHAIPGHNLTAGALGVFILWFCWFGFNGGSSLSLSTDATMTLTGLVCFNTNLAAAVATCVTMIFTWLRYGKPDVSMTLNGSLAGLVAITAGCDTVSPFGAFFIGFVAGYPCGAERGILR